MNYSHPVHSIELSQEVINIRKEEVEGIIDQQIIISKLGNITFTDTDNMDTYERVYVFKKLMAMKKEENRLREEQINKINNRGK